MSDWDNDDDGAWGISSDEGDWSADKEERSNNPAISAEHDARIHSPPAKNVQGAMVPSQGPVALVAQFDAQGQPLVARTQMRNGKPVQLEEFRRPTPDEYNSLMFGGKIVRGGVVGSEVPAGANLMARSQRTPLGQTSGGMNWKRIALYAGVGTVAIGGGWFAYKKLQERKS